MIGFDDDAPEQTSAQDDIRKFLEQNKTQDKPLPKPAVDDVSEFIRQAGKTLPTEESAQAVKDQPVSMGTRWLQSLGVGVVQGVTAFPAGIADWMHSHHLPFSLATAVGVPPGSLEAAQGLRDTAAKNQEKLQSMMDTGIFSPSALKTLQDAGEMIDTGVSPTFEEFLGKKAAGWLLGNAKDIVTKSPEQIGSLIGGLPANAGTFGLAKEVMPAVAATNALGNLAKHFAASTISAGTQSYFMHIKDGVSPWIDVAKDMAVNGMFELIGLPMSKAWKGELGKSVSTHITDDVSTATGVSPEVAEAKITQIRSGAGISEPHIAERLADNPLLDDTPLQYQAKTAVQQYWEKVVPQQVNVDGTLDPGYGVSFNIYANGKKVNPQPYRIMRVPNNPNAFAEATDRLATGITKLSQQGASVRIDDVSVAQVGAWQRFSNRLRGLPASYGKMDARALTTFEENLGQAAPAGTVAESGVPPTEGTRVSVTQPGKPTYSGVVAKPTEPTAPGARPTSATGEGPSVPVTNATSGVTDNVPTKYTKVWLQEKQVPQRFVAHTDGTERRFIVDLNHSVVSFEGVDAHKTPDNYYRSSLFTDVDHEGTLGNGPRGFIHQDGSVTISVTKGNRLLTYPQYGIQAEVGPLDSVTAEANAKESVYKTPSERVAHNMSLGSPVQEPIVGRGAAAVPRPNLVTGKMETKMEPVKTITVPGEFQRRAGFMPRAVQDVSYSKDPFSPEYRKAQLETTPTEHLLTGPEYEPQEAPGAEVTAAARGQSFTQYTERGGRVRGTRVDLTKAPEPFLYREMPERYSIDKGQGIDDPNFVDAQRTAKLLLDKNMAPSTPVKVLVTDTTHSYGLKSPHDWTLEELAHAEPGLFDLPQLRVAAVRRGYKAVPDGVGVILRDTVGGNDVRFDTRVEAANFLSKQRMTELGPPLEQQAESMMRLGWMKSFDAAVDGGDFQPAEAQHVAASALLQGNRPLTKLWVQSDEATDALRDRVKAARKNQQFAAAQILTQEGIEKTGLNKSLNDLETRMGLTKGTFKVMDLGNVQGDKAQVAVYSLNQVEKFRQAYGEPISRLLKVPVNSPEQMLKGLATRPGGLDILMSPDPESSIIYAAAKSVNNRALMDAGTPINDQVTSRTYRIYDQKVKDGVLKNNRFNPCIGA